MPEIKAKFKVIEKAEHSGMEGGTIKLSPVYSSDETNENRAFWMQIPGGAIDLVVNDPQIFSSFKINAEYYIDFTKCEAGIQ